MPVTINGSGPVTGVTAITGAGLDLITTQTFSAASSVSVNNCFSATYENYRLVVRLVGDQASAATLQFRLRASGTDSSASYNDMLMYATSSGSPARESTSLTYAVIGWVGNASTSLGSSVCDIFSPFASSATALSFIGFGFGASSSTSGVGGNDHRVASSYDGFTLLPSAGTITGTLRVYGYRNS